MNRGIDPADAVHAAVNEWRTALQDYAASRPFDAAWEGPPTAA